MEREVGKPHISALESVRTAKDFRAAARMQAIISILLLMLLALTISGAVILAGMKPPEFEIPLAGFMVAVSVGVIIWFINIIRADFYWETSTQGLLARGFFRCRLIEWTQIREVISSQSLVLLTNVGEFKLPTVSDQVLVTFCASIWQHLAEINSPASLEFTSDIESLWTEIPADTPREVDWVNPEPPKIKLIYLSMLLGWCALFALWYFGNKTTGFRGWHYNWIIVFIAGLSLSRQILWPKRIIASKASVRNDALSVELPEKSVIFDWPSIESVNWWDYNLYVKAGKKEAMIPFDISPDASTDKLILSIIRHLREADPPVLLYIPDLLRDRM